MLGFAPYRYFEPVRKFETKWSRRFDAVMRGHCRHWPRVFEDTPPYKAPKMRVSYIPLAAPRRPLWA